MRRVAGTCALTLMFVVSDATAQTSTCMAMGGGMVHCDHLGGGWTDCNSVGGNMATCHTMGVPEESSAHPSDGGGALKGIASIVTSLQERSVRKKVGGMLAAGDCDRAAKYAFAKGRLELGSEIQRSCRTTAYASASPQPAPAVMPLPLSQALQLMASRALTPAPFDANTTITKIQAAGSRLTFSAVVKDKAQFTEEWRNGLLRQFCEPTGFGRLMTQGATVRLEFEDQKHGALGVTTIRSSQCH